MQERRHSQTQLSGRFRLVMTSTLPDVRWMGIAQQTTRGVARPFVPPPMAASGRRMVVVGCGGCASGGAAARECERFESAGMRGDVEQKKCGSGITCAPRA